MGATPGPWRIVDGRYVYGPAAPARQGQENLVALAYGATEGRSAANARLIAAAPELLAAIREQQRIIDAQSSLLMAYRCHARAPEAALQVLDRLADVEKMARSAEAKATGLPA